MAVKFTNNAKTTLASGINSSVTTATVTDGSVFPTLGSGEHFYCTFDDGTNNEIVKVTARSGNTLTIVRGVDNTTARAFSASDAAELRATSALLIDIQENIAAKSANQTVYSATTASSATSYDIGIDPGVEANASVFLNGVYQHHNTFSFSGSTLTFDTAPPNGMALEVLVDNLVNLQSSNLTVDTFTAADVGGNPQTDFTLSDAPAAEDNLLVFIDGVFQDQDAYTISNQTLTITDGVTADFGVTVYVINPVNIGTPSDGTVTSSKLSGNITMPADFTVTGDVAFDSPTFVVDNANSRVGIGTASPSTLLDIVGDVKMSANLTVDTSTLVVDATNNRVGIGTNSPSQPLTVSKAGDLYIQVNNSSAGFNTYLGTFTNESRIVCDGAKPIAFFVNGSRVVDFANGGKVGIGNSSPQQRLTVGAGSGSELISIYAGTGSASGIHFTDTNTSGDDFQGFVTYDHTADALRFGTAEAERMRIDSSGNLLVGKTATGLGNQGAELSSTGQLKGTAPNQVVAYLNRTSSDGTIAEFRKDNSAVGSIGVYSSDRLFIGAGDTNITFKPSHDIFYPSTATGAARDNAIDLGDSGARFKNLYLSGGVYANNGSGAFLWNAENAHIVFGTNNTERMRIDASGRVGIGTSSPDGKLHVYQSDASITPDADADDFIIEGNGATGMTIGSSASSVGSIRFADSGSPRAGMIYYNHVGNEMRFYTVATERMRIDSSGDLLINGASRANAYPERFLTLSLQPNSGEESCPIIELVGNRTTNAGNQNGMIQFYNKTGTQTEVSRISSIQGSATNSGELQFHIANAGTLAEAMRIDSSGRLLVDTTSIGNASTNAKVVCDSEFLARGSNAGYFWENRSGMTIASQSGWGGWYSTGTASHFLYSDGANRASIGRTSGTYTALSDVNKKKDFEDSTVGLAEVMQLQPKKFRMLEDADDAPKKLGFIAQDVENVIPEAYVEDFADDENEETFIGLTDRPIIAALTKAIQEQQTQIETLKQEIREIREGG